MNILHLRYAIEVERTHSISRAAENLFMNQSNLSRAIRELEQNLNITLFRRTSQGVIPTPEGEAFLCHAREIVAQIDRIEELYRPGGGSALRLSIAAPASAPLSAALAQLCAAEDGDLAVTVADFSADALVDALANGQYKFGILRHAEELTPAVDLRLRERSLACDLLCTGRDTVLLSSVDALADTAEVTSSALADYTRVTAVPAPSAEELPSRRIAIADRLARLELVTTLPCSYTVEAYPDPHLLHRPGLIALPLADAPLCRTLLLYRKNVHLTPADHRLIDLLHREFGKK